MESKMKSVAGVIFLVKDLEVTKEFYETLGFTFKKEVPDVAVTAYLNWFWIEFLLENKAITEAFKEDVEISPKGIGQYVHINVENVDAFHREVITKAYDRSVSRKISRGVIVSLSCKTRLATSSFSLVSANFSR